MVSYPNVTEHNLASEVDSSGGIRANARSMVQGEPRTRFGRNCVRAVDVIAVQQQESNKLIKMQ